MKLFRVILAGIAMVSFVCLAVFGLLITAERLEHTSYHTSSGSCPFMPGEISVCLMSLQDHVSAWQNLLLLSGVSKVLLSLGLLIGWWWFSIRILLVRKYWRPFEELPRIWFLGIFGTTIQPCAP